MRLIPDNTTNINNSNSNSNTSISISNGNGNGNSRVKQNNTYEIVYYNANTLTGNIIKFNLQT